MNQAPATAPSVRPSFGSISRSTGRGIARFWSRYPTAMIASIILLIVLLSVLLADIVAPFDPNLSFSKRLLSPMDSAPDGLGTHLLGTDSIGRDLFSRILHGGRVSLIVGLIAPTLGITVGALVGITSAYMGGATDLLLQRATDTLMAIPSLVLAMAITITLGFTLHWVIFAIAVSISPYASRLLRSHALVTA